MQQTHIKMTISQELIIKNKQILCKIPCTLLTVKTRMDKVIKNLTHWYYCRNRF